MIETGNTLKSTREAMGLSLDEVFKDLDIPVIQLEQIEAGAVGSFDDIFELKRMMLEYAKYLGINTEDVEKKFNEYMFDYTSKIPMNEIQKAINAKEKEMFRRAAYETWNLEYNAEHNFSDFVNNIIGKRLNND